MFESELPNPTDSGIIPVPRVAVYLQISIEIHHGTGGCGVRSGFGLVKVLSGHCVKCK